MGQSRGQGPPRRGRSQVLNDLELMRALARYLETHDPELARYRPTILVGEFEQMMRAAIDLSQELSNLQRFQLNFANEPDVVIPTPYPELSRSRVLTMTMLEGTAFSDRAGIEAIGWDVDALVRRATEIYLEMIFRDGIYHADPHPGNFLLPDSEHLAILDFGDVGRVSDLRRRQLESMVIATGTQDVDALTDVIVEMTTPPADIDVAHLRDEIDTWLNRYLLVGVGKLDMAGIIDSGTELMHANGLVLPADLALLFRVLLRLQGLGRTVGTELRVTELLTPYVHEMMAKRFDPRRLAHQAARAARELGAAGRGVPPGRAGDPGATADGQPRGGFPSSRRRRAHRPARRRDDRRGVDPGVRAAGVPQDRANHRRLLDPRDDRGRGWCVDLAATRRRPLKPHVDGQSRTPPRTATRRHLAAPSG